MRTLEEIIDESYVLFAPYPPGEPLDVCTFCCMTEADATRLAGLPVRSIPRDLLTEYNDSAKPEKTSVTEVKHFLPRYLELVSQFQFPSHSCELSFSRLAPFDRNEWAPAEQQLLDDFSRAFFRKCLSTYPIPAFGERMENILIMFRRAGFNIAPLLSLWEEDKTEESVLHFRDLHFHAFTNDRKKLTNTFADAELAVLLSNWMDQSRVKARFASAIEALFMTERNLNEKDTQELDLLYDLICSGKA
jgi:hypothetical protein